MQAPVASVRVSCKLWRLYPWTVAFHKLSEWHLLVRCIQHKMLAVCFSRCHWSPLYFWWYRLQEVRSNHKQSGCKCVIWEVHLRRQWSKSFWVLLNQIMSENAYGIPFSYKASGMTPSQARHTYGFDGMCDAFLGKLKLQSAEIQQIHKVIDQVSNEERALLTRMGVPIERVSQTQGK